jgi:hypothetical protein
MHGASSISLEHPLWGLSLNIVGATEVLANLTLQLPSLERFCLRLKAYATNHLLMQQQKGMFGLENKYTRFPPLTFRT